MAGTYGRERVVLSTWLVLWFSVIVTFGGVPNVTIRPNVTIVTFWGSKM